MSAVKYGMMLSDHGMPLLLSVYSHDGTVTVVQGGVEMGQGLFMKVRRCRFTSSELFECTCHRGQPTDWAGTLHEGAGSLLQNDWNVPAVEGSIQVGQGLFMKVR